MSTMLKLIQERHSTRASFDRRRPIAKEDLLRILEAARWSPTPHNMQNFEIIVVDDKKTFDEMGKIRSPISEAFIRENYGLLSFSEGELLEKKVGILGAFFPKSWTKPPFDMDRIIKEAGPVYLEDSIDGGPLVLVVAYDAGRRAPASEGDFLGILGLGCVMENMWLMAQELGIGFHVLSEFGEEPMEKELITVLGMPERMRIAFAVRLGYPASRRGKSLRVRREVGDFAHHNRYGRKFVVKQVLK